MRVFPQIGVLVLAVAAAGGAPLVGVHVNPADIGRAVAWEQWTGRAPDIIGDNLFAGTWPELAGQVPAAGARYSLDRHVPPPGAPPNPLAGRAQLELGLPLFPRIDVDGTAFRLIPDRMARGAAGEYDEWWRKLAEQLVARGLGDCWLRPGWEMNIPDPQTEGWDDGLWKIGNSGVVKHQQFAAYWRRCHAAMMSVEGARFRWTWCMLSGIESLESIQRVLDHAYPGDAYVDFIAGDLYDTSNFARYLRGHWQETGGRWLDQVSLPEMDDRTWEELGPGIRRSLDPAGTVLGNIPCLDLFRGFARQRGKPFLLSEWGLEGIDRGLPSRGAPDAAIAGGNDNPRFIASIARWAAANEVHAVTYFDFFLGRHAASDGSHPAFVESAILPGFWDVPARVGGKPLHPLAAPNPRAAAVFLTAFHPSRAGPIPAAWHAEGRQLVVLPRELAAGSQATVAVDPLAGDGWIVAPDDPLSRQSTGPATATAFTPLGRYGRSSHTVSARLRAGEVGQWAGLVFLAPAAVGTGYAFEARCGPAGLPDAWRLRKNGATVWQSVRAPLLSELAGVNWLLTPVPLAVTVKPGPEGSLRIEMHFGADTAGHFNDPAPLPATAANRSGVTTSGAGAATDSLAVHEPLADEDFEDGSAEGWSGAGWATRRLQYHAAAGGPGLAALAGDALDRNYALRARLALTDSAGAAGLTVLADAAGNGFRLRFTTADATATRRRLAAVVLERTGDQPAELASWSPDATWFTGIMHDFELRAEARADGDLDLTASLNGRAVVQHREPGAAGRRGRFGPWASPGAEAWADDLRCVPLAGADRRAESRAEWQARHFGPAGAGDPPADPASGADDAPAADPDGDGATNEAEFLAGSNPRDPRSVWRCDATRAGGLLRLGWGTVPHRIYQLERSAALAPGGWEPVGAALAGTGVPAMVELPRDGARGFYRVRVSEAGG